MSNSTIEGLTKQEKTLFWDLINKILAQKLLPRNIWSKASPLKGIKSGLRMARKPRHIQSTKRKENIPYFKPPYCRGTDN